MQGGCTRGTPSSWGFPSAAAAAAVVVVVVVVVVVAVEGKYTALYEQEPVQLGISQ